ncbi:MAG: type II toxin-antitoxin system VapC family toxin [Atopobiaceae bacterium]|nr:type II toxin-antitoxin system VapC family toxin [Atopobiaceae bacterium]
MNCLIDTHIALWALGDPSRLPAQARALLLNEKNRIFCSVISAWEVANKHAKHPEKMAFTGREFSLQCKNAGYEHLSVLGTHALELDGLRPPKEVGGHSDPFDRMLICQAKAEGMMLVTHDQRLAAYGEPCVLVV